MPFLKELPYGFLYLRGCSDCLCIAAGLCRVEAKALDSKSLLINKNVPDGGLRSTAVLEYYIPVFSSISATLIAEILSDIVKVSISQFLARPAPIQELKSFADRQDKLTGSFLKVVIALTRLGWMRHNL